MRLHTFIIKNNQLQTTDFLSKKSCWVYKRIHSKSFIPFQIFVGGFNSKTYYQGVMSDIYKVVHLSQIWRNIKMRQFFLSSYAEFCITQQTFANAQEINSARIKQIIRTHICLIYSILRVCERLQLFPVFPPNAEYLQQVFTGSANKQYMRKCLWHLRYFSGPMRNVCDICACFGHSPAWYSPANNLHRWVTSQRNTFLEKVPSYIHWFICTQ